MGFQRPLRRMHAQNVVSNPLLKGMFPDLSLRIIVLRRHFVAFLWKLKCKSTFPKDIVKSSTHVSLGLEMAEPVLLTK